MTTTNTETKAIFPRVETRTISIVSTPPIRMETKATSTFIPPRTETKILSTRTESITKNEDEQRTDRLVDEIVCRVKSRIESDEPADIFSVFFNRHSILFNEICAIETSYGWSINFKTSPRSGTFPGSSTSKPNLGALRGFVLGRNVDLKMALTEAFINCNNVFNCIDCGCITLEKTDILRCNSCLFSELTLESCESKYKIECDVCKLEKFKHSFKKLSCPGGDKHPNICIECINKSGGKCPICRFRFDGSGVNGENDYEDDYEEEYEENEDFDGEDLPISLLS